MDFIKRWEAIYNDLPSRIGMRRIHECRQFNQNAYPYDIVTVVIFDNDMKFGACVYFAEAFQYRVENIETNPKFMHHLLHHHIESSAYALRYSLTEEEDTNDFPEHRAAY